MRKRTRARESQGKAGTRTSCRLDGLWVFRGNGPPARPCRRKSNPRHPSASGGPSSVWKPMDSRFRGNDVALESALTSHPTLGTRHLPYRLTLAFGNLIILKRLIKWSVLGKQGGEGARCSPPPWTHEGQVRGSTITSVTWHPGPDVGTIPCYLLPARAHVHCHQP